METSGVQPSPIGARTESVPCSNTLEADQSVDFETDFMLDELNFLFSQYDILLKTVSDQVKDHTMRCKVKVAERLKLFGNAGNSTSRFTVEATTQTDVKFLNRYEEALSPQRHMSEGRRSGKKTPGPSTPPITPIASPAKVHPFPCSSPQHKEESIEDDIESYGGNEIVMCKELTDRVSQLFEGSEDNDEEDFRGSVGITRKYSTAGVEDYPTDRSSFHLKPNIKQRKVATKTQLSETAAAAAAAAAPSNSLESRDIKTSRDSRDSTWLTFDAAMGTGDMSSSDLQHGNTSPAKSPKTPKNNHNFQSVRKPSRDFTGNNGTTGGGGGGGGGAFPTIPSEDLVELQPSEPSYASSSVHRKPFGSTFYPSMDESCESLSALDPANPEISTGVHAKAGKKDSTRMKFAKVIKATKNTNAVVKGLALSRGGVKVRASQIVGKLSYGNMMAAMSGADADASTQVEDSKYSMNRLDRKAKQRKRRESMSMARSKSKNDRELARIKTRAFNRDKQLLKGSSRGSKSGEGGALEVERTSRSLTVDRRRNSLWQTIAVSINLLRKPKSEGQMDMVERYQPSESVAESHQDFSDEDDSSNFGSTRLSSTIVDQMTHVVPSWFEDQYLAFDAWIHGWVMDESNIVRRCWDIILFGFLVYSSFSIPYACAFVYPNPIESVWYRAAEVTSDVVFHLDVLLNFFTAYRDDNGLTQWNLETIAIHYTRGWLLLDLCCAITWDHIFYYLVDADAVWPPFLRFVRLLILLKLQLRLKQMERYISNPGLLRLFRLGFVNVVAVHWCTCITHTVAKSALDPDRWFGIQDYLDQENSMQYFSLMYWVSTTMLGDRSLPQDLRSTLLTVTVFWAGFLLYFTIFSNLITVLVNMNLPAIEYNNAKDKRVAYMRKLLVPMGLRLKIMDYFEAMYNVTKGVDSQMFMAELPRHLQQELAVFLYKRILDSLSVFGECSLQFLTAMLMRLQVAVCLEGDILALEGDFGDEMFFIISGEVDIFKTRVGKVGTIGDGDFFGEGALIQNQARRNATVKATKACTLYTLSREKFEELRKAYPEDSKIFFYADQMRRTSRKLVKHALQQPSQNDLAALAHDPDPVVSAKGSRNNI